MQTDYAHATGYCLVEGEPQNGSIQTVYSQLTIVVLDGQQEAILRCGASGYRTINRLIVGLSRELSQSHLVESYQLNELWEFTHPVVTSGRLLEDRYSHDNSIISSAIVATYGLQNGHNLEAELTHNSGRSIGRQWRHIPRVAILNYYREVPADELAWFPAIRIAIDADQTDVLIVPLLMMRTNEPPHEQQLHSTVLVLSTENSLAFNHIELDHSLAPSSWDSDASIQEYLPQLPLIIPDTRTRMSSRNPADFPSFYQQRIRERSQHIPRTFVALQFMGTLPDSISNSLPLADRIPNRPTLRVNRFAIYGHITSTLRITEFQPGWFRSHWIYRSFDPTHSDPVATSSPPPELEDQSSPFLRGAEILESLTPDAVGEVINRQGQTIGNCDPGLEASLQVNLTLLIAPGGYTTAAFAQSPNQELNGCLVEVFRLMQFPAASGTPLLAQFSIGFQATQP